MKLITLPNGQFTKVDDEDFDRLNAFRWRLNHGRVIRGSRPHGQKFREIFMHREVIPPKPGFCIDHIDRDPTNNQKSNLRYADPTQSVFNRKVYASSRSGIKNVKWCKRTNLWLIRIRAYGKIRYNTRRKHLASAIEARDAAYKRIAGEFAPISPDRAPPVSV